MVDRAAKSTYDPKDREKLSGNLAAQVTQTLAAMHMFVSDVGALFLRSLVSNQSFLLELKMPSAEPRESMKESRATMEKSKVRVCNA